MGAAIAFLNFEIQFDLFPHQTSWSWSPLDRPHPDHQRNSCKPLLQCNKEQCHTRRKLCGIEVFPLSFWVFISESFRGYWKAWEVWPNCAYLIEQCMVTCQYPVLLVPKWPMINILLHNLLPKWLHWLNSFDQLLQFSTLHFTVIYNVDWI